MSGLLCPIIAKTLSSDARTQAVEKAMLLLHFLVSWVSPSHLMGTIMMGTYKVKPMNEKVANMKGRRGLTVFKSLSHKASAAKLEISSSQRLSLMSHSE